MIFLSLLSSVFPSFVLRLNQYIIKRGGWQFNDDQEIIYLLCEGCKRSFPNKSVLDRHRKTHRNLPSINKNIICSIQFTVSILRVTNGPNPNPTPTPNPIQPQPLSNLFKLFKSLQSAFITQFIFNPNNPCHPAYQLLLISSSRTRLTADLLFTSPASCSTSPQLIHLFLKIVPKINSPSTKPILKPSSPHITNHCRIATSL